MNLLKSLLVLVVVGTLSISGLASKKIHLFIAGDSIAANYSDKMRPLCGWGEILPLCFNKPLRVRDLAVSGSSTRTFVSWGKWPKLLHYLRKGDYVMIAFGHNDEKSHKVEGYSDPDTTFQDNLKRFVKEVRAAGAHPILLTPPVRLIYDKKQHKLLESHRQDLWHAPAGTRKTSTTYQAAVRKVAKETNTPLLDLNQVSREKISSLPDYQTMTTYYRFAPPGHPNYPQGISDTTHFSVKGAAFLAYAITTELRRIKSPLVKFLKSDIKQAELEKEFKKRHNLK